MKAPYFLGAFGLDALATKSGIGICSRDDFVESDGSEADCALALPYF
jgi:hypothetical protein